MKNFIFAIFGLLTANFYAQSPVPSVQWAQVYPGTSSSDASSSAMVLDAAGNAYITGFSHSGSIHSYCTIKYSPAGNEQWVSLFTGPQGVAFPKAIALDGSSNIYVTGYSNNPGTFFDFCTVKINSNGTQEWVRYYNGPGNAIDESNRVGVDNQGNIYVSGFSALAGGYSYQYAIIKYSPDGEELWVRRYGTPSSSTSVNGLKVDNSGNVYITGCNNSRSVTLKYNTDGNLLWELNYCGNYGITAANDIALDENSNVYIAGYTTNAPNHRDFFALKYSTEGTLLWERKFNSDTALSGSIYVANSVCIDMSGNVFVGGYFMPSQSTPRCLCVVKYSNSGDTLWVQKDSVSLSNQTTLMDVDEQNNVYIGSSNSSSAYMFLKYDNSGNFIYRENYNVTGAGNPVSMMVDPSSNIYITGEANNKMLTVKYSYLVGEGTITSNIPNEFKLEQNYPNPFNPATKIKFDIPDANSVQLIVYDMLGNAVATLVDRQLKAGTYLAEWNAENFTSGIYFAVMYAGELKLTKKMVLVK